MLCSYFFNVSFEISKSICLSMHTSYLSAMWLITLQLVFFVFSVSLWLASGLMVNLAFEEMWSPTLCCFISSTHLIDRVPTEPPPSHKRAECTVLSVWQLGFLHLRLTKSKKARRKDSVIDRDRPFQNSPSLWTSHLKLSPAGSVKL